MSWLGSVDTYLKIGFYSQLAASYLFNLWKGFWKYNIPIHSFTIAE